MKCSIYVRNGNYGPSCYYRLMQYFEEIQMDNLKVTVNNAWSDSDYKRYYQKNSKLALIILKALMLGKLIINRYKSIRGDLREKTDIVIIQREVFPRMLPIGIRKLLVKLLQESYVVWDFDDDILNSGEISNYEWKLLNNESDLIIGISDYSKSLLNQSARDRYVALPTTDKFFDGINVDDILEKRKNNYNDLLKIVWLGTAANLFHIDLIINQLELAAKKLEKKLELIIVCSEEYVPNTKIEFLKIKFVKWTRESAFEEVLASHVGIMPLMDTEFAKGKGGFKLIQYLAASLPVIASDVGFNSTVVDDSVGYIITNEKLELWEKVLVTVASDEKLWLELSRNARRRYENEFSFQKNKCFWKQIIEENISR